MRWSLAIVLAALLAAPLAVAQNTVVADIPFPFAVAGKAFPPGEWTMARVDTGGVPLCMIKDRESRDALLVVANVVYKPPDGQTRLVFNRYGDRYFLSVIWLPDTRGYYFIPMKEERDLRLAGIRPERTVMFARLR